MEKKNVTVEMYTTISARKIFSAKSNNEKPKYEIKQIF